MIKSYVPIVLFLLSCGVILGWVRRLSSGGTYPLRRIAALDAVTEAIGRATELGRPVFFTAGIRDVATSEGMQVVAGVEMLSYVAEKAAEYGTRVIATVANQNVFAMTAEVLQVAYKRAGHPEVYREDDIRFLSPAQMAYAAGTIAIMRREKIGASFLVGGFAGEAMIMADAAVETGAIQISGTARMAQLPLLVAVSDYCLLGEEIFATGAYFSGSPVSVGSLAGQDVLKLVAGALVLGGSLLATMNITFVKDLLGK